MTASPQPLRDGIFQDATDLAAMAEALGRSADYRVLRRLVPRTEFASTSGQATKTGILLDTETTGLDHSKDEIIELGMVTCRTAGSPATATRSPLSTSRP
jgi:DNA polymerase-3 subunit epsilon